MLKDEELNRCPEVTKGHLETRRLLLPFGKVTLSEMGAACGTSASSDYTGIGGAR